MREIKFRAWCHRNLTMLFGYPIIKQGKLDSFVEDITGSVFGIEEWPFEVMQFTGLYDKNGKEIYEGDILVKEQDGLFIVVYDPNDMAYWLEDKSGIGHRYNEWQSLEVVGNTFQNPELLEPK